MSLVRAFYRLLCLVIVCFFFVGVGLSLKILFSRKPHRRRHYIAIFTNRWAKCFCYFLNIRLHVEGQLNASPNALIVCNHVGSPDIFVIGACFKTFFISKNDIAKWPLAGVLAKWGQTIFVNRARRHQVKKTIQEISEYLHGGFSVVLFPEGRANDGSEVTSFKTAHFEAAVKTRRTVIPVMIRYLDSNRPSVACWIDMSFSEHLFRLLKNPVLRVRVRIFPKIRADEGRRELAAKSWNQIQRSFLSGANTDSNYI